MRSGRIATTVDDKENGVFTPTGKFQSPFAKSDWNEAQDVMIDTTEIKPLFAEAKMPLNSVSDEQLKSLTAELQAAKAAIDLLEITNAGLKAQRDAAKQEAVEASARAKRAESLEV